jgi:hypothetical protein
MSMSNEAPTVIQDTRTRPRSYLRIAVQLEEYSESRKQQGRQAELVLSLMATSPVNRPSRPVSFPTTLLELGDFHCEREDITLFLRGLSPQPKKKVKPFRACAATANLQTMRLEVQNFVTAVMGMIETPNLISVSADVHWNALVNRLSP